MPLHIIYWVAYNVRDEHMGDVHMFLSEGYSVHDCVEINRKVAEKLRKLGFRARLARPFPELKHFFVAVRVNGKTLLVDAVPELSGQFSEVLPEPFIGTMGEAYSFYLG